MPANRTDLLSATRLVLRGAVVIDVLTLCILTVVIVALFIGDPAKLTTMGPENLSPEQRLYAARVGVIAGLISCTLGLFLLRLLLALVDSARSGDPFVPENGRRLRHIGSLLLVINAVVTVALSLALHGRVVFPVSLTSLITVLMVFVLARIFEVGSQMRAELKETV